MNARLIAQACIKAAESKGLTAMALRRGDPHSGIIYVKSVARDGRAQLFAQSRDINGELGWRRVAEAAPEAEIDARIDREHNIDSDMWAIEVMDDAMAHPLDPRLIKS